MDDYEFSMSNMIMDNECNWIRKVSLERRDTDEEQKVKEIKERLIKKYTPEVFEDNLEGKTVKIDPVNIVVDENLRQKHPPREPKVARDIPITINPLAQDLIRGMIKDKVIKEVHSPTIFCARTSFIPKADGSSLR